ncbi:MAG: galactokinase family protein [Lachnospiraceae bacterium]|nr:galactokinase family protein [Lachnospiraceae bacterium]
MSDFRSTFGRDPEYLFTAPGRIEVSGNHTDHQHGCVMAAAINLETRGWIALNGKSEINMVSEGHTGCTIDLGCLESYEKDKGTSDALVAGIAYQFAKRGALLQGFDIYVRSEVLKGSGMSSSASFEVMIGNIFNHLFFDDKCTPVEIAQIGQWSENNFYGKPCGLMDQTACSVGNFIGIDFEDPSKPVVEKLAFDFSRSGHSVCVIDSGANHAHLDGEYAAITQELKAVCRVFGKEFLRDVDEEEFYSRIAEVRKTVGDRAALRAIHVFNENKRVKIQSEALNKGDFDTFLKYASESGRSSWRLLQNVIINGQTDHQEMALALQLAWQFLEGRGAARVNGGGFAGTILAFVPDDMLDTFKARMENALGAGSCLVLKVNPQGGGWKKL